jgi:molybdenum cofactor cytidylyltransferase
MIAPSYIAKYFASTEKRHLCITGDRGCGKSTLLRALVSPRFGFITKAEKGTGVTFCDIESQDAFYIGKFDPKTQKMVAEESGFERATSYIDRAISLSERENSPLFFDEIGYIEREQNEFLQALDRAFCTRPVYAVLRKCDEEHIQKIAKRSDVCLFDMTRSKVTVGCVVMASGLSKRYGRNKLTEPVGGKPLAEYAVSLANLPIFSKRVMLTRLDEVEGAFSDKIKVVKHSLPTRGEALALGLAEMSDMDGVMFLQADQPLVKTDSIKNMLCAFWQNPERCYRLSYDGVGASPIIFPKRLYGELQTTNGKGGNAIFSGGEQAVLIRAFDPFELEDIDTAEDRERIEKIIRQTKKS